MAVGLALGRPIRQILRVHRWLWALLLVASTAHAGSRSNPAFLGIEMLEDVGGCRVEWVTACSPAKDAGLRMFDVIVGMDGQPVQDGKRPACDVLRERIMTHGPGEVVTYDVRRGGEKVAVKATLATRADVQHRCFVGQRLRSIDVTDVDNEHRRFELADLRGKTTVLGWFRLERCAGCGEVFDAISDAIANRLTHHKPAFLGLTPQPDAALKNPRVAFASTVPLALVNAREFDELTLKESDRIQFMVVDARGVIRFVAPIAPGSEDLEAAIDDLLAAVEQADRSRK